MSLSEKKIINQKAKKGCLHPVYKGVFIFSEQPTSLEGCECTATSVMIYHFSLLNYLEFIGQLVNKRYK